MQQRKTHVLRANKRSEYPQAAIFFDVETDVKNDNVDIMFHHFRFCVAQYKRYKPDCSVETQVFDDREAFWKWVMSKTNDKQRLYLFAHNTDFDFRMMEGFTYLAKWGFYIYKQIVDQGVFIMQASNRSSFKGKEPTKKLRQVMQGNRTIQILDTFNYFKYGLKTLGELLGLPKLEMPEQWGNKEKDVAYCKRDVEITRLTYENYIQFLKNNDCGNFGLTIAGQAFNTYRHRFMDHKIVIHINEDATALERSAYYGGRVECFHIGQQPIQLYYKVDINSQYPYVMEHFTFPTKLIRHTREITPRLLQDYMSEHLVVARGVIKIDKPCIPKKGDGKLIFPIGEWEGVLCHPELELLFDEGGSFEPTSVAIYEHAPIFIKYVKHWYKQKVKYQRENNNVYRFISKLFQNTLYGKFGQRNIEWEMIDYDPIIASFYNTVWLVEEKREITYKCVEGTLYEKKGWKEGYHAFPAISAFITSYARRYLWQLQCVAGREHVYYSDTDSLIVDKYGYENLHEYLDEEELGKLAIEGISWNLKLYNAKDYRFGSEEKIKGVPKSAKRLNDNIFATEQWERMSASVHTQRVEQPVILHRVKDLKRIYDKGIVNDDLSISPIELTIVQPNYPM